MRFALLAPVILLGCARHEFDCGAADDLCAVEDGEYFAEVPRRWDGESLLPAFVHFHGHNGSAGALSRKKSFHKPMGQVRAVAIYPDGLDGRWNFRVNGGGRGERDDVAFTRRVVADALERFPIDPDRVVISGFSVGASMAWEVACQDGDVGTVFAPVSGALWMPLPADCAAAPERLRHVHGGGERQQGKTSDTIDLMRSARGCTGEPRIEEQEGELTCQVWDDCDMGTELQFCLHDGMHLVREGWHERTLEWAFGEGG